MRPVQVGSCCQILCHYYCPFLTVHVHCVYLCLLIPIYSVHTFSQPKETLTTISYTGNTCRIRARQKPHIPTEVMFSLGFLVAFRSSFLKFLQIHREASPLSDIMHSHNSSSLKAGCNTYNIRDNIKPLQNFQTMQDAPSPRGTSSCWLEILKKTPEGIGILLHRGGSSFNYP